MSVLNKLTEGIVDRDLSKEGAALLSKWERTGLLEGLDNDRTRNSMARLLENQAKELLRETSSMAGGDVEGFAAVAFPIVRRVFGGLIANDLVSVQPMSLPSGLIFFLDFTTSDEQAARAGMINGNSLYGGGKVGAEITGGVSLAAPDNEKSFYNLNNGYSSPTGSLTTTNIIPVISGCFGASSVGDGGTKQARLHNVGLQCNTGEGAQAVSGTLERLCRFDPDFTSGTTNVYVGKILLSTLSQVNLNNLVSLSGTMANASDGQARRLTAFSGSDNGLWQPSDGDPTHALVFFHSDSRTVAQLSASYTNGDGTGGDNSLTFAYSIDDDFVVSNALGSVIGDPLWGLEEATNSIGAEEGYIPEIDIKVDSVSITAMTKKLKAKWTPELGQDLNAYHNLDAEVELTSILSEQIALEIDREILEDLVKGATAGSYYWSRHAGKFVNRTGASGGQEVGAATATPDFTGTVSEWYETLVETINDVSAQIHRKTLRGGANFIVVSPEVANILEFTAGFRANVTGDVDKGTVGAVKTGSLSKKWDVFVDPYFPRNLVLVGRKGGSFLESGYVYAPYVPLQVTPTIFGTEDFVPRKGVMTRYGKKMVRPDMYGLVIVVDLV
jgi:hypothetical protein